MDSDLLQRQDRVRDGNNFQDTGIRKRDREEISIPKYQNKYEFLNEIDTSDDEVNHTDLAQPSESPPKKQVLKGKVDASNNGRNGTNKSMMAPKITSFEQDDYVCQAHGNLHLPVHEDERILPTFLHKKMHQQAISSLNTKNPIDVLNKEIQKQKIAKLRLYHSNLINVKPIDKNKTFNGLRIDRESQIDPPPKKKKKDGENSEEASSDDDVFNALNQR